MEQTIISERKRMRKNITDAKRNFNVHDSSTLPRLLFVNSSLPPQSLFSLQKQQQGQDDDNDDDEEEEKTKKKQCRRSVTPPLSSQPQPQLPPPATHRRLPPPVYYNPSALVIPARKIITCGFDIGSARLAYVIVQGTEKCITKGIKIIYAEVVDLLTDGQNKQVLKQHIKLMLESRPFLLDPRIDAYAFEKQSANFGPKRGNPRMQAVSRTLIKAFQKATSTDEYKQQATMLLKLQPPVIHSQSSSMMKQTYLPTTFDFVDVPYSAPKKSKKTKIVKEEEGEEKTTTTTIADVDKNRILNKKSNKQAVKNYIHNVQKDGTLRSFFDKLGSEIQKDFSDAMLHALSVIQRGLRKFDERAKETNKTAVKNAVRPPSDTHDRVGTPQLVRAFCSVAPPQHGPPPPPFSSSTTKIVDLENPQDLGLFEDAITVTATTRGQSPRDPCNGSTM